MSAVKGLTAKGVPALPSFLLILRGVVLFLSVAILAASGVAISVWAGYDSYYFGYGYYTSGPPGFMIFVVCATYLTHSYGKSAQLNGLQNILTLGVVGGTLAVEKFAPQMYFRLAVVIAYTLNIIFMLSAWSWCASNASSWLAIAVGSRSVSSSPIKKYGGSLAAAAALGALTW
jgi:hypothetical protein